MVMRNDEAQRLERRKYVLMKFLAIEPDTMSGLRVSIGGDTSLTERALYDLVQEGKVAYRGKGLYSVKEVMVAR